MTCTGRFPEEWRKKAESLKNETIALILAYRHPRTPWYAKVVAATVAAYALSPIDLIPDFIPVLGYLDDLLLIPAGIALVVRLVPPEVMAECRKQVAEKALSARAAGRIAGAVIAILWVLIFWSAGIRLWPHLARLLN